MTFNIMSWQTSAKVHFPQTFFLFVYLYRYCTQQPQSLLPHIYINSYGWKFPAERGLASRGNPLVRINHI